MARLMWRKSPSGGSCVDAPPRFCADTSQLINVQNAAARVCRNAAKLFETTRQQQHPPQSALKADFSAPVHLLHPQAPRCCPRKDSATTRSRAWGPACAGTRRCKGPLLRAGRGGTQVAPLPGAPLRERERSLLPAWADRILSFQRAGARWRRRLYRRPPVWRAVVRPARSFLFAFRGRAQPPHTRPRE
jgi:hypothetical protein